MVSEQRHAQLGSRLALTGVSREERPNTARGGRLARVSPDLAGQLALKVSASA
jgi:hypothetical protein